MLFGIEKRVMGILASSCFRIDIWFGRLADCQTNLLVCELLRSPLGHRSSLVWYGHKMQTPLSKRRLLQWVVVFSFAVSQFAVKNASWNPWLFHLPLSVILPMVKYLPRWWSDTLWVVLSRLWLHSLSLCLFWFGWKWHNSSLKSVEFSLQCHKYGSYLSPWLQLLGFWFAKEHFLSLLWQRMHSHVAAAL